MVSTNNMVPPSSTTQRVNPITVQKAVESLLKWKNSKSQTQKSQLSDQEDFIYLILTLKKIPAKNSKTNPHNIPLPHPIYSEFSEICLFIDDRPKLHLTKDAAKKKIQSENIPISKVIKFSELKSDYRSFEAKRKLCYSYDMLFADISLSPLLPKALGKPFIKKKKIPVPLNLKHNNWKEQIEIVLGSALLHMSTGTCRVVRVGRESMGIQEIVENVGAAVDGISEIVPKKWANVRSFHLKLLESIALPIYQAVPGTARLKIDDTADKGSAK